MLTSKISGKNILVVDDEDLYREIWTEEFSSIGAKTFSAENGAEALKILQNNKIDLIVSDYNMPQMNGLQFMDEIQSQKLEQTPFIFIITGQCPLTAGELCERGADAVFLKPCKFDSISQAAQTILSLPDRKVRRFERVNVDINGLLFNIQLQKSSEALISNLSAGGCSVKLVHPLNIGETVFIEFNITSPSSTQFTFRFDALVRWSQEIPGLRGHHIGLEFQNMKSDDAVLLEAWVHSLHVQNK